MDRYDEALELGSPIEAVVSRVRRKSDGQLLVDKAVRMSLITDSYGTRYPQPADEVAQRLNVVKSLRHSYLVDCVDHCECDEGHRVLHIITEYMHGGHLKSLIAKLGRDMPIPEMTILRWFIQIARVLQFLHRNGVSHRNLKSSHVFLTSAGDVKIADIGLSVVIDGNQKMSDTFTDTEPYLAPEVWQEKHYNEKVDVWSLGILLYEMMTRSLPFTQTDLKHSVLHDGYPAIEVRYSPGLQALLLACLTKDPEYRPDISTLLEKPIIKGYPASPIATCSPLGEKYVVLWPLGKGAHGVALLVRRVKDGLFLVAKEANTGHVGRDAVLLEARALCSLGEHPNIIHFMEYIETPFAFNMLHMFIVMEHAAGGTLRHAIENCRYQGTHFQEPQIWTYATQLCAALTYTHQRHVLHRDVKPENVFLTLDGSIKLGDFGLSAELSRSSAYHGTWVGTPQYISPEMCRGENYGVKSDVWALGCVIYELAMLNHPFSAGGKEGTNIMVLSHKITSGKYEPIPSSLCSERLSSLVAWLLNVTVSERPTMREVGAWLEPPTDTPPGTVVPIDVGDSDDDETVVLTLAKMRERVDDAPVQRAVCAKLHVFLNDRSGPLGVPGVVERFVEAGGIAVLLTSLHTHLSDARVQTLGWEVLGIVADGRTLNAEAIGASGGVTHAVAAMEGHKRNAEVQAACCGALRMFAWFCAENCTRIAEAKGIEAVLWALQNHTTVTEVQKWACAALDNIALGSPAAAIAIGNQGGIAAIVRVVRQYTSHRHDIVSQACAALRGNAKHCAENRRLIAEADGICVLLCARRTHKINSDVQRFVFAALQYTATDHEDNAAAIINAGGIADIATVMMAAEHLTTVELQEWGCGALGVLFHWCRNNDGRLTRANDDLSAVHEALHLPESNADLTTVCNRVLGLFEEVTKP